VTMYPCPLLDLRTMFGIPLRIGYTCPQFGQVIAPSSICICSRKEIEFELNSTIKCCRSDSPPVERGVVVSRTHHRPSRVPPPATTYRLASVHIGISVNFELTRIHVTTLTCFAALTNAAHSIFGINPLKKSGLNSASRSSTCASFICSGKLLDVQPLA
jgi:hypothetical protein